MIMVLVSLVVLLLLPMCVDGVLQSQSAAFNFAGDVSFHTRSDTKHRICHTELVGVRSAIECGVRCLEARQCCAYSHGEETCCLSDICLYSPDITEERNGWTLHSRHNVVCQLYDQDPTVVSAPGWERYIVNYSAAGPLCSTYGGTLASLGQLQQAYNNGYDLCSSGWLNDQTMRFPCQTAMPGCCLSAQLRQEASSTASTTKAVWCHFQTDALFIVRDCWPLQ